VIIMGGNVFTNHDYGQSVKKHTSGSSFVTRNAEEKAISTGKLDPQVNPAEYGVIRYSKPRYIIDEDTGLWKLEVGIPMPIETRLDTTGSMGNNVDKALKVLPKQYNLCSGVLPDFVLQLATGIFGDCDDKFVLCRPKFAYSAERLVERLTLMVPERNGWGNGGEDPHYGLFGAAYLTDTRINKYGLKGYDFTISDEPARDSFRDNQLVRVFGPEVFAKISENGFKIDKNDLPSTKEVVQDLLNRSHAFFIQIDTNPRTTEFWEHVFGKDHVISLLDIDYLPHIQALIVGLTEGTVSMNNAVNFLAENDIADSTAEEMVRSVSHIPIGAQAILKAKINRPLPQKGDLFKEKTDLWPVESKEIKPKEQAPTTEEKIEWL
jgi:transcriptional regulator of met regulon